ncbi:MAG: glycosyltransferase family 4 protein [Deltaproteobacteria bacterium]|nr:glycosyltransferase family 4 protein [Deltaproteobacteria bacterium]
MSFRIGIDTGLFPASDHGGLAVYRRELVRALADTPGDHRLILYGHRPPVPAGVAGDRVEVRDLGEARAARVPGAFRQVLLPAAARRDALDVVHFPLGGASLGRIAPSVVSVHDLLCVLSPTLDYPVALRGLGFRLRKRWHRHAIPASLARADRLLASSEATRDDLVRLLGVAPERISVAPLAAAPTFATRPSRREIAAFLGARGLPRDYLLALSSIDPRKNAHRVIDAYAKLPSGLRASHALVILLTQGTYARSLKARADRLGIGYRVALVPHLDERELPLLYAGAAALAFPSLFEGFGLPVLEAMSLAVPVVTSRVGGLPEVGGDAVDYVDPRDPGSIAAALERVLADYPHAELMREAGAARAARFSWERTAALTLDAYRAVCT